MYYLMKVPPQKIILVLSLIAALGAIYFSGIFQRIPNLSTTITTNDEFPKISVQQIAKIPLIPLRIHNGPNYGEGDPAKTILAENLWQLNGIIFFIISDTTDLFCRDEAQRLKELMWEDLNQGYQEKLKQQQKNDKESKNKNGNGKVNGNGIKENGTGTGTELRGVELVGIVAKSQEVEEFAQKFFHGFQIFQDSEQLFFKALQSTQQPTKQNRFRLFFSNFFSPRVWWRAMRAWFNTDGKSETTTIISSIFSPLFSSFSSSPLLRGVLIVSPPTVTTPSAVIYQHSERFLGDSANIDGIRLACQKIQKLTSQQ